VGLARGLYIRWGTDEHTTNVATGWARADVAYVHRPCATNEHKGLIFVGHVEPMNISYVRRSQQTCVLMFIWLCSTITDEHILCSLAINIYSSVFG
jgi:hypothetical protein